MSDIIRDLARWIDDKTRSGGAWRDCGGVYFRSGRDGEWTWIGFARTARGAAIMLARYLKMTIGPKSPVGRWRRLGDKNDCIRGERMMATLAPKFGPRLMSHDVPGHEQRIDEYTRRADAMRPLFDPPVAIQKPAESAARVSTFAEQIAAFALEVSDE